MNHFFKELLASQKEKKTYLCVGLDPHLEKLPLSMRGNKDAILPFLKEIIDATVEYACCFKPQIAYFSAYGLESALEEVISYIHNRYSGTPIILDSKRNDIGSTAQMYAREAFVRYQADAVTLSPYMGGDTIEPFTSYKDKGAFVLCRTSNEGAKEFQNMTVADGQPFYTFVAERALKHWSKNENIGLVVGATAINELRKIRSLLPEAWFLVPGVGAQGGDLQSVIEYGKRIDGEGGIVINSARGILYASEADNYAQKAKEVAMAMQQEMAKSFT